MQSQNKSAFTLVELIVVITILTILWTIAFISLLGYGLVARDTVRVSDLQSITKVIELYKLQEWFYPPVSNPINVTFSGSTIWQQGSFWDETRKFAKRISEVPVDPLTFNEFAYSRTLGTQEYQLWAIIEKESSLSYTNYLLPQAQAADGILSSFATTVVKWNYNGKFITHKDEDDIYILWVPSILANEITDITLQEIHANQSFVYEWGPTAPATYSWAVQPQWSWNFTPTDIGWDIAIIHQGTIDDLNTWTGKLNLITDIQTYYTSTDVKNSSDFWKLASIDPINNPNEAIAFVNTYIQAGIGGLWGDYLTLTPVDTSIPSIPTPTYMVGSGWDYSSVMNNYRGFYNSPIIPNTYAFAALKTDGSIEAWWNTAYGWNFTGTWFTNIYSSKYAFAALKTDGSIEAWWSSLYGWSWEPTGTWFTNIFSTERAFTAIHKDGYVESWGDTSWSYGGNFSWTWFTSIFSHRYAFAGLKEDGGIIAAWTKDWNNGISFASRPGPYSQILGFTAWSQWWITAMKTDWDIEWWDSTGTLKTISSSEGVMKIFTTWESFATLKEDGSIEAWWNGSYWWIWAPSWTWFVDISSNLRVFAALHENGTIYSWWYGTYWWTWEPSGADFVKIHANDLAFAALKTDGGIEVWWDWSSGWSVPPTGTGFTNIFSTERSFAALKGDGSIETWWYLSWTWKPPETGFINIYSTPFAFAAMKADGSMKAWWHASFGWDWAPTGTGFVSINGG
jgi:prepilin-type N-terminal cleavage/methylation domain-containing protein